MSKRTQIAGRKQSSTIRIPMAAWIAGAVVLAIIALGAILLSQQGAVQPPLLPPEISVTEASAKRDSGAFILDVREPSEWADAHISGATLIPLGQLPTRLSEVPKDKDIVVICRTGHRSAQGRDMLLQAGYSRVTSVAGGLTAWRAQGLSTASGQ